MSKILSLVFLLAALPGASAQPAIIGNDTGGIIAWSPENEYRAFAAADAHCAGYRKLARVTSVYRQPGHYIGFACAFPPGYILRERDVVVRTRG